MNLNHVQYVHAIAEHGSFSEAAKHLYVSQSALSQQIRNLELELGYTLFHRSAQGAVLTLDGEHFCALSRPALEAWDLFLQQTAPSMELRPRHLRIGMGSRVYSNGLFEDIVRFFDQHSELEVTFVTEAGQDFASGLRSGTLDLALDRLVLQYAGDQSAIAAYDLIREKQCILLSPDHPLSHAPHLTFSELEECTMMTGLENSIEDLALRDLCKMYGISFKRIYRSDSIETIMRLVRSGKGIVYGPRSFADYYGVAAVPLWPEKEDCLRFLCLRRNASRPDILLLRKYLTAICKKRAEQEP